jgi:hypothetical protein
MKQFRINAGDYPAFFNTPILSSQGGNFNKLPSYDSFVVKNNDFYENLEITGYGKIKKRRNDRLEDFKNAYQDLVIKGRMSVLCLVVWADKQKNINNFIKYFKNKKLWKLGIKASSHCRVNDIGQKSKRPHWHVFIATSKINETDLKRIFKESKKSKYTGILMDDTFSLVPYCQKKELYKQEGRKSWSS